MIQLLPKSVCGVHITRVKMVFSFSEKLLLCCLISLLNTCFNVEAKICPGDKTSKEKRGQALAGDGMFEVEDTDHKYLYKITLCKKDGSDEDIAISQEDIKKPTDIFVIGNYKGMKLVVGTDWMMVTYLGARYKHHCNKTRRQAIVFISCDYSADTHAKRKPIVLKEHRETSDGNNCYYLFEMNHSGVCPAPPKTKISPGSVFIIIVVIIGILYVVLGLLYQRFIVGAKGLEQIPNYLMWREFGTLQADGCNYMCRCKTPREPTRYKPMDDAIADDDEHPETDDTLLPM